MDANREASNSGCGRPEKLRKIVLDAKSEHTGAGILTLKKDRCKILTEGKYRSKRQKNERRGIRRWI